MDEISIKPDEYFRLHNGEIIRNLSELFGAVRRMEDEVFFHHVRRDKNDFSNWVRDVLKDETLAAQLEKLNTRNEFAVFLKKKISEKKLDIMLNNILMIENAKKINPELYSRKRILSHLKRVYEDG